LRLNFSANAPHVIEDGIARLARIVKQLIGRNGIVRQEA
jgi:hypothetical protein